MGKTPAAPHPSHLLSVRLWSLSPLHPTSVQPLPLSRAGSWHPALGYLLAPSSGSGCRSALLLESPAYLKCSTWLLPPSSFPAPAQPFSWVLSTSSSRSPCVEAFFLLFLILSASLSEMLWSSSRGRVVWFFFFFPIRHLFLESFHHYSTVWMPHDLLL